jgi:hypothetical protein
MPGKGFVPVRIIPFMSQQERDNLLEASLQNYHQSAFPQLPGEIRNQIYGYIFDEDINVSKRKRHPAHPRMCMSLESMVRLQSSFRHPQPPSRPRSELLLLRPT